MKIGIITVHRAHNYGSVLQCFALQEFLKKEGHFVEVIDYRQAWTEAVYKRFSFYYILHFLKKKDLRAIIDYIREYKNRSKKVKNTLPIFEEFQKKFNLSKPCRRHIPSYYDAYIIGSDQLWSTNCVGGKDNIYLGRFHRKRKSTLIGYAISASVDSLLSWKDHDLNKIISNFDHISLREKKNIEIVDKKCGIRLPLTIDPTLLLDSEEYDDMINTSFEKRNYIAIYQVRHIANSKSYLRDKAKEFAKELSCDIIDLSDTSYSVEDFISIIKYAKCVLTTSFHAVVFSIIMRTPFYAIKLNDGYDVRYVDLLRAIGLEEFLVSMDFNLHTVVKPDFQIAKERINALREDSIKFLSNAIK